MIYILIMLLRFYFTLHINIYFIVFFSKFYVCVFLVDLGRVYSFLNYFTRYLYVFKQYI